MVPYLRAGLVNQCAGQQELIYVAQQLNAVMCWPWVYLEGIEHSMDTQHQRPFEALYDREHFRKKVLELYGVTMAWKQADIEFCDYSRMINTNKDSGGIRGGYPASTCANGGWRPAGLTCQQLEAANLIKLFDETPQDLNAYRAAYQSGTRMIHLPRIFWQWMNHDPNHPLWILKQNILRPSPRWQPYVDKINDYYDRNRIPNSYVIGIHLRLEDDMGAPTYPCSDMRGFLDRIRDQLKVHFHGATCIVGTGLRRCEFEHQLPCGRVLTKHQAFGWKDPFPELDREEAAVLDLWTVSTRVHLFVGCGASSFSIAAAYLHQGALPVWQQQITAETGNALDVVERDTGEVIWGWNVFQGCFYGNAKWIQDHNLGGSTRCG